MKPSYKHFSGQIILGVSVIVCALLPLAASSAYDLQKIKVIHTADIQSLPVPSHANASLAQKIQLISKQQYSSNTQIMDLKAGVHFDLPNALDRAKHQIDILSNLGLLPENSTAYTSDENEQQPLSISGMKLMVDSQDPTFSSILWTMQAASNRYNLSLNMDDDSGKIVSLRVTSQQSSDVWISTLQLESMAKAWSKYLDLSIFSSNFIQQNIPVPPYNDEKDPNSSSLPSILSISLKDEKGHVEYDIYSDLQEFEIMLL